MGEQEQEAMLYAAQPVNPSLNGFQVQDFIQAINEYLRDN